MIDNRQLSQKEILWVYWCYQVEATLPRRDSVGMNCLTRWHDPLVQSKSFTTERRSKMQMNSTMFVIRRDLCSTTAYFSWASQTHLTESHGAAFWQKTSGWALSTGFKIQQCLLQTKHGYGMSNLCFEMSFTLSVCMGDRVVSWGSWCRKNPARYWRHFVQLQWTSCHHACQLHTGYAHRDPTILEWRVGRFDVTSRFLASSLQADHPPANVDQDDMALLANPVLVFDAWNWKIFENF